MTYQKEKDKNKPKRKRSAMILYCTSSDDDNKENDDDDEVENIDKNRTKTEKHVKTKKITKKAKRVLIYSSNDESYEVSDIHLHEDHCVECLDNYTNTKSKVDWIQCVMCQSWLHETCTLYRNYCKKCGRIKIIAAKKN